MPARGYCTFARGSACSEHLSCAESGSCSPVTLCQARSRVLLLHHRRPGCHSSSWG